MAKWIKADGTEEDVSPKSGKTFSLAELEKYTGGYPFQQTLGRGAWMVVDEEANYKADKTINKKASDILQDAFKNKGPTVKIIGNVLICTGKELGRK